VTRWTPFGRLSAGPAALRVAVAVALLVGVGLAVFAVSRIGSAVQIFGWGLMR